MSWYWQGYAKQQLERALQIQKENPDLTQSEALAQASNEINSAVSGKPALPYVAVERPRLLEEGLPVPPDYLFMLAIYYMMKKEPKMLQSLAIKWLDAQARIIGSLAQAGAGNIITAYSHSFLIALILEQQYYIRQRGADDLIAGLNWLTGAQELSSILQGFAVPEVLTFAATGVPISPGRAGTSTSNITKTDIAQLAKALKG